jgi:glyoxylase-like metal-dependent hydrolase (beta-lactamase superfamily II)
MNRISFAPGVECLEMSMLESWTMINGLFINGTERIMIDGRMGGKNTVAFIRENRVNRYFISHFHVDHGAGAWSIAANTECRPALNETERENIASRERYASVTGYGAAGLQELVEKKLMPMIGLRFMPDLGSYSLAEIEDISGGRLTAIPTPGHSPGHFCLYAPDSEAVFAGDLGMDLFGPWYGFPHCSIKDFLASIDIIRGLKAKVLFSSHGPVVRDNPDQVFARSREIISERHGKILDAWGRGLRTVKEIAAEGFFYDNLARLGKGLVPLVSYWQENMVAHHLEYAGLLNKTL